MNKELTTILRKDKSQYIALCLELNVSAFGETILEVKKKLSNAIDIYLEDIIEFPDTIVEAISIEELVSFLRNTESIFKKSDILEHSFNNFEIKNDLVYV